MSTQTPSGNARKLTPEPGCVLDPRRTSAPAPEAPRWVRDLLGALVPAVAMAR